MIKEAIEFIQEYQEGKYGYAVRGEAKAWMYYMMTKCKTDDDVYQLHYVCENILIGIDKFNSDPEEALENAWVTQEGDIFYCQFGHHRLLCEKGFMELEKDFEKKNAKVRYYDTSIKAVTQYMDEEPSKLMLRALKHVLKLKR